MAILLKAECCAFRLKSDIALLYNVQSIFDTFPDVSEMFVAVSLIKG